MSNNAIVIASQRVGAKRRPMSEAIHCAAKKGWIASSHPPSPEGGLRRTRVLLAMTEDTNPRSRGATRPSFCMNFVRLKQEGAGNAGRPMRHGPLCDINAQSAGTAGTPDQPGIPCAIVLRLIRALLGDHRWVATVIGGIASADLAPASERQDHTTSPSAATSFVLALARLTLPASTAFRFLRP